MLRTVRAWIVAVAMIGCVAVGHAYAQSRPVAAPAPGPWGPTDTEAYKKAMAQYQQQQDKQMQEALGATDEEFKVLKPKIEKVQTLTQQASGVVSLVGVGADPAQVPDLKRKMDALKKLLKDKEAKAEDISLAMKEYREARDKMKEDLAKAQKDLKEVLTVRQEAVLLTMGLLL